jgi:hypothetical protein
MLVYMGAKTGFSSQNRIIMAVTGIALDDLIKPQAVNGY